MLHDMIERVEHLAQVQADFLVYNILGDVHTYGDLKADSDALATYIDFLKIEEKSPVLVFGGQEHEMLASFVGLTESGHAYISADQHSALERIEAILAIAEPSLTIAVGDFPLGITHIPIIKSAELKTIFVQKSDYHLTHSVRGDDNYYIIFTSSTAGQPKGVQISHDNLLSFTNWMIEAEAFSVPRRPQMLAQPPYSFDSSVMYWAPTLALGGTLLALPKELTADFRHLLTTINQSPIGAWTPTPSFVDMAILSNDFNHETLPNLMRFYFDGKELTMKTAQKLCSRSPKACIVNTYSPTEATVALSAVAITDETLATCKRLPTGYTKIDSPTFVIDENGNPLLNGEQGEIIVSGPAVSKGYLNNPERTQTAFFEFNGLPAYHTGDLGIMIDHDMLLYGGRMDFQIKFSGYRIEPEKVSQNLSKSAYIKSAVAVPRYNKDHKVQNLLAYVALKDGVAEQFERQLGITKVVKEELKDIMMDYMMLSRLLYRDSLPLTTNGRIDTKGSMNEVNRR